MVTDVIFCFFFCSSRRRHTRWPRDWSSDVCSSDLNGDVISGLKVAITGTNSAPMAIPLRSEERRVGKECKSRRSPYHKKKKKLGKEGHMVEGLADEEDLATQLYLSTNALNMIMFH